MKGAITNHDPTPSVAADINDPGWKDNFPNVLIGNRVTDVVLNDLTITGGSAMATMADNSVISDTDLDGMELFAGQVGDTSSLVQTVVPVSNLVAGGGLFFTAPERTDPTAPADLTISHCVFARNHARGYGGAILLRDAVVDLSFTTFDSNVSDLNGGAISALNSTLYTESCFFTNNVGNAQAGAVDLGAYPTLVSLSASTTVGNGGAASAPFSDVDKTRVAVSHAISAAKAINKGLTKALNPSTAPVVEGIGPKIKALLPTNPFKGGLSYGARAEAAYDIIGNLVGIGNEVVDLAELFGVSKDDPNIKRWNIISEDFSQYATPAGLISLGLEELGKGLEAGLKAAGIDDTIPPLPLSRTEVKRMELQCVNPAVPSYFMTCYFKNNTTQGEGGAILDDYEGLWVEDCWFANNTASTCGGAIAARDYTMPRIISSAFWANDSDDGASAIANTDHAASQVLNCTFYQNTSTTTSGYALDAQPRLERARVELGLLG